MAFKYDITIGAESFTGALGSYTCERVPVYTDSVVTMDGVEHKVLIRTKSAITFSVNPLSSADTARLFSALSNQPVEVTFFDSQINEYRSANMVSNIPAATLIRGMTHNGSRYNEIESLTLEEL